ncbi:MAG: hypothetical protein ACREBC_38535, partial [Pyrinomonadaceae bacterium]
ILRSLVPKDLILRKRPERERRFEEQQKNGLYAGIGPLPEFLRRAFISSKGLYYRAKGLPRGTCLAPAAANG